MSNLAKNSSYGLTQLRSRQESRNGNEPAVLSITKTERNGNRIAISPGVIDEIGSEQTVQIAIYNEGIAIGNRLAGIDGTFTLRISGKKSVVYCRDLVDEITEIMGLDFGGKTTISFYDVTYQGEGEGVVAYIPLMRGDQVADADMGFDDSSVQE